MQCQKLDAFHLIKVRVLAANKGACVQIRKSLCIYKTLIFYYSHNDMQRESVSTLIYIVETYICIYIYIVESVENAKKMKQSL